jgi:hypothetical protein
LLVCYSTYLHGIYLPSSELTVKAQPKASRKKKKKKAQPKASCSSLYVFFFVETVLSKASRVCTYLDEPEESSQCVTLRPRVGSIQLCRWRSGRRRAESTTTSAPFVHTRQLPDSDTINGRENLVKATGRNL